MRRPRRAAIPARPRTVVLSVLAVGAFVLVGCTSSAQHPTDTVSSRNTGSQVGALPATSSIAGTIRRVVIPGKGTGFRPRAAYVYLPPSVRAQPHRLLPVLELLHGTPGGPADWVSKGGLAATLDSFAANHSGRAPIVVLPDINGAVHADSECVRTPYGGNVERYLVVNVPNYVLAHFPASHARRNWAIAGVSEGGTCAAMLALRTHRYHVFGDLSGLKRPTLGESDDPQRTIRELFGGSRRAYRAHDVLALLRSHTYPELAGWFACGASDRVVRHDQAALVAAARSAQVRLRALVLPGGHSWSVWRRALRLLVPWLWARIA